MDDATTRELRLNILDEIEDMDIELLKRIAYECRCEENGIYPDNTYIRWWWLLKKIGSLLISFSTNSSLTQTLIWLIYRMMIPVMIIFNSTNSVCSNETVAFFGY